MEGKQITRDLNPRLASSSWEINDTFQMNYYDIEISNIVPEIEYKSGR